MRRVYRHYTDMEEYRPDGMWRNVAGQEQRQAYIDAASTLMADPVRFKDAMLRAIEEWPNSCEVAMTTPSLNHLAWFGHAGCCIATGSPEDCTRLAWHTLDEYEQAAANDVASQVIAEWRRRADGASKDQGFLFWVGDEGA
jgi:hypothetical protein